MTLADIQAECAVLLARRAAVLPRPADMPGFSTEGFIWSLCTTPPDEPPFAILEILAKKIEVGQRLCSGYDDAIAKVTNEDAADTRFIEALAAALLFYGVRLGEWKWINTVLKLDWGILRAPEYKPSPEIMALAQSFVDLDP